MASRILKAALSVAPVCGSVPIAGNVASLAICGYDSSTIVFTRHGSQILSLLYHPRRRKTSPRWRDPDRVGINSLAGTDSEARRAFVMKWKAHLVSVGSVTGGAESLGELELGVSGSMLCLVSLEIEKQE